MKAVLASSLLCLALLGCATPDRDPRLVPGQTTSAQLSALYGPPKRIWPEADDGQTLEYSSQPFGQTCYMIRLDGAGRLLAVEDTLLAASRFKIEAGMTPEQVSRRLGAERSRMFFRLSGEEVWDWNVAPDQNGYLLRFNVHFKDGRVLRSTQTMEFPTLDRDRD